MPDLKGRTDIYDLMQGDMLSSTGIEVREEPKTPEEKGYKQTRPRRALKLPKYKVGFQGETEDEAKERWLKSQGRYLNGKQRQCSKIDAFVALSPDTKKPHLYIVFPLKQKMVKPSVTASALLPGVGYQKRPTLDGKVVDKLLMQFICKGQVHPDGRPTYNAWFAKGGKLVVAFPLTDSFYASIPLYPE